MAYKRKFTKRSRARKSTAWRAAPAKRASMARKRLIRTIKAVSKKVSEPKEVNVNMGKTELYHNTISSFHLNKVDFMPTVGTAEYNRIGDQIYTSGFSLRMLIGQKSDRPNVTFIYYVLKVPKGSSYVYGNWFTATTNNVLLDNPNTDFVTVVKKGIWRPNEAGLGASGGDEYTFTKKLWVPYNRRLKFGPATNAQTHNDSDLWFIMAPYDAYGALIEDNVAYAQIAGTLYYRDP